MIATPEQTTTVTDAPQAPAVRKLYLAAWRWHFYAGIYVIPFLIMLSLTGLVMLFHNALETVQYRDELFITPTGEPQTAVAQIEAVRTAYPEATISEYIPPTAVDRTAQITVITAEEQNLTIFVNPYTTAIVGTLDKETTWYAIANRIHGDFLLGDSGDMLIEIAAGFGIMLVITGLYLWWPRDKKGLRHLFIPRLKASKRIVWRDLHGSVGFYVSLALIFFLISGLAWTNVWGGEFVQPWNSFPAEKWGAVSLSDETHASLNHGSLEEVPWNLEQTPLPVSGSLAGVDGIPAEFPVNADTVIAFAKDNGFTTFRLNLPRDAEGVYTISADTMSGDITNPTQDRTVHIDQYSGKQLGEVAWDDYTLMAKGMAAGIALHQGDAGTWNFIANTIFCLAIIFISISSIVMWWMRRPKRSWRLVAPPMPKDMPLWKGAVFIMLLLSLAFPLVGITLLILLGLDLLILSRIPFFKTIFN